MPAAELIQDQLRIVETERATRAVEEGLNAKVSAIKRFQQQRFRHTYADLLLSQRHGAACRFFLEEIYGAEDFSQRDAQFARVVPSLVRLFPKEIIDTVAKLAELHAFSEQLDTEMGRRLAKPRVDAASYISAWQSTGRHSERITQIELTLDVARSLDSLTRKPLLRNGLRLMRAAAGAASLGELQRFLECGFDTFKAMNGAQEFIEIVGHRERKLSAALFGANNFNTTEADDSNESFSLLPSSD